MADKESEGPLECWILWGAGGFGAAYHAEATAKLAAQHGCVERIVHMVEACQGPESVVKRDSEI